jgi:hypothetical protein
LGDCASIAKIEAIDFSRPGTKPNADHVYRFTNAASRTIIQSGIRQKERLSLSTVQGGLRHLTDMLVKCHGFTISAQDTKQIGSLLNRLVKENVLFKGRWQKANRVGFKTLLYLVDTHMGMGLTDGVHSWDVYISKQLSIVLVAAFASRCGEVVQSALYQGMQCLCFKDLCLEFSNTEQTQGIIMNVSLRFVKGYKYIELSHSESTPLICFPLLNVQAKLMVST